MLAKKYRLKQTEVKKVLQKGKPFFSYNLGIYFLPHRKNLWHARFAIVIGGKSVSGSVVRNAFRRRFYALMNEKISHFSGDFVCVIKKSFKLNKDSKSFQQFESEIRYLFDKKIWKNL